MANVYSAVYGDSDFWDGTTEWGYDATSDIHTPTAHVDQAARDAQYTAAYTSCAAWEAARGGVAQSADTEYCIIQSPWSAVDAGGKLNMTFTNTPTIIVRSIGAARHSGTWDVTAHILDESGENAVQVVESDVTLDGLQGHVDEIGAATTVFTLEGSCTGVIFKNLLASSASEGVGIRVDSAGAEIKIYNCVVFSPDGVGGASEGIWLDNSNSAEVYNCIVDGFNDGIERDAGSSDVVKNCAVFNNGTDFDGTMTIDYCASDDGTGDNPQTLDNTDNYAGEFTDMPNNDYSLVIGSVCIENGADDPSGSGDGDPDIIGTARSSTWDIGVYEFVAAGGLSIPLLMHQFGQRRAS